MKNYLIIMTLIALLALMADANSFAAMIGLGPSGVYVPVLLAAFWAAAAYGDRTSGTIVAFVAACGAYFGGIYLFTALCVLFMFQCILDVLHGNDNASAAT